MIRIFTVLGVLKLVCFSVFAQQSFTLKEAQDYAVKHNYEVLLAEKNTDASKNTVKVYTSVGFPQISASGNFQNFINIPTSVAPVDAFGYPDWFNQWIADVAQKTQVYPNVPPPTNEEFQKFKFGSNYTATGGVSVNQLIFDGAYFVGLKAAKTYVEVMSTMQVKTESEIRNLVAQTYNTVVVSDENVKILAESKTNLEQTLRETKALYDAGFVEEMAVEQLQLMVANVTNSYNTSLSQKEVAKGLLKFQMGIDQGQDIDLKDNLNSLLAVTEITLLTKEFNVESHIDLKLNDVQIRLMELNYKAEKSKRYPQLSGFFNHQYNSFRNDFDYFKGGDWFPSTLWGLNLKIPIFSGFGSKYALQNAKIDVEKAQIQNSMIKEGLKLQLETARSDYSTAMEQMKNQKENLALAEKIKNKTMIKFNEGVASSMDLSQSETQLLTTQGNYIQSVFMLLNAKAKLDKAMNNQ